MNKYRKEIILCSLYAMLCLGLYFYANINGFKLLKDESGTKWSSSTPYGSVHHK